MIGRSFFQMKTRILARQIAGNMTAGFKREAAPRTGTIINGGEVMVGGQRYQFYNPAGLSLTAGSSISVVNVGRMAAAVYAPADQPGIVTVATGGSGSSVSGGNADTVDGYHAFGSPLPGALLALSSTGTFPASVMAAISIDNLSDVAIDGTPADNELLAWDTTGAGWINQTAAEAGVQPTLTTGNLTATSPLVFDQTRSVIGGAAVVSLGTQTANYALAGPTTGAAAAPTFRALVAGDLPADGYTGYLLATGARTGATAQVQSFTYGVSSTRAGDSTTSSMSIISTEPIFRFAKTNGIADYQKFEIRQVSYTDKEHSYLQFRSANDANSVFVTRLALFNTGMLYLGQGNPAVGATAYMMNIVEDTSTVGLMIRAAATTPLDAIQVQNSATTVVQAIRADGTYYADSTSTSPGIRVSLTTPSTASVSAISSTLTTAMVADSAFAYSGTVILAIHNKQVALTLNGVGAGGYAQGGLIGFYGQTVVDGAAGAGVSVATALGSAHQVLIRNGGVVTNAIGVSIQPALADVGAGTVTNAYGVYIKTPDGASLTLTNSYGIYLQDQNKGGTINNAITTNAGAVIFNEGGDSSSDLRIEGDTDANLFFTDASADSIGVGTNSPDRKHHVEIPDAGTNAVVYAQRLSHITSNPAGDGFGTGIEFELEDGGGNNNLASTIAASWVTAATATRKAKLSLSAYDTAVRLGLEIEATGTVAVLKSFGTHTTVGRRRAVVTKTGDYTAAATDEVIVCDKGTAMTITLPAATGTGQWFAIGSIGAGAVTVDGSGAEVIDGQATQILYQYDAIQIVDYAAGAWKII